MSAKLDPHRSAGLRALVGRLVADPQDEVSLEARVFEFVLAEGLWATFGRGCV